MLELEAMVPVLRDRQSATSGLWFLVADTIAAYSDGLIPLLSTKRTGIWRGRGGIVAGDRTRRDTLDDPRPWSRYRIQCEILTLLLV